MENQNDHIEGDDWDPKILPPDYSIFNLKKINFTSIFSFLDSQVKQNLKKGEKLEDEYYNDIKLQNNIKEELTKMLTSETAEEDELKLAEEMVKNFNDEIFYDPQADEKDQSWVNNKLKLSKEKSNVAVCPNCFSPLSYDIQPHETQNQFRANNVINCKIDTSRLLKPENEELLDHEIFFPVNCGICECEIGVYEFDNKLYHFIRVITSF